jgi:hypothetical protein
MAHEDEFRPAPSDNEIGPQAGLPGPPAGRLSKITAVGDEIVIELPLAGTRLGKYVAICALAGIGILILWVLCGTVVVVWHMVSETVSGVNPPGRSSQVPDEIMGCGCMTIVFGLAGAVLLGIHHSTAPQQTTIAAGPRGLRISTRQLFVTSHRRLERLREVSYSNTRKSICVLHDLGCVFLPCEGEHLSEPEVQWLCGVIAQALVSKSPPLSSSQIIDDLEHGIQDLSNRTLQ